MLIRSAFVMAFLDGSVIAGLSRRENQGKKLPRF
jgi:hypothetical protein